MTATEFYKGETIILSIEVRDKISNVLTDPASVLITIIKSKVKITDVEVVKINEVGMSKTSTGKYCYNYDSDEVGIYNVVYKAIRDLKNTISKDFFSVIN